MDKIIYYFVIGSFIGWLMEVIFKKISNESIDRAGMGKGPFCMAYGLGMAFLAANMTKYSENIIWLFISIAVMGTIYEYFLGVIMEKYFDIVLWDYTKLKFYINKHICLEFVFLWGFFGTLFITKILPILDVIYSYISCKEITAIIYVLSTYICIDYGYAALKLFNLKKNKVCIENKIES